MMREFELFSHWTFESFTPGSIPRRKFNAFSAMQRQTGQCLELLAQVEELANGRSVVDWCRVTDLVARLIVVIANLVEQLRIMNPVEFMDVHEWSAKLGFYARLATDQADVPAAPPYLLPFSLLKGPEALKWVPDHLMVPAGRSPALAVMPALYAYFVEANDLRPQLDAVLRELDLGLCPDAEGTVRPAGELIQAGRLPQLLEDELEIAAVELAPKGGLLDLWAFTGSGNTWHLIGQQKAVRPLGVVDAWKKAAACKFSLPALCRRLSQGMADGEELFAVVATPAGQVQPLPVSALPCVPDAAALVRRLEQVLPRVTQLHVFQVQGLSLSQKHCRSLQDLVCLCLERGLSQIFAFAGVPARGLAGIKQMRLEIPVVINTFNLGGGLFPSAAERSVITVEDVRSIPAWSLLLGLTCPDIPWAGIRRDEEGAMPHSSSYAVLSQFFMHCTLRLGQNLYVAECRCEDGVEKYVHFRFKGGNGDKVARARRLEIMRLVLEGEGFAVASCGDYLEALRVEEKDVLLQRNLVCLGVLVAWIQITGVEILGTFRAEQGLARFRSLLTSSMSSPA